MQSKQKTYWWIDLALFTGFILAFFLDLTGVELHQWLGILGGLLALVHLLLHQEWLDAVGQRFFGRTAGRARLYYVLDTLLFAGFVLMALSGLVVSTWLNLELGSTAAAWLSAHILISIGTLLTVLLKLALHWRWILKAARGAFGWLGEAGQSARPVGQNMPTAAAQQPRAVRAAFAPTAAHKSRREFLQVMGVVGTASLLALLNAGSSLAALQDDGAQEAAQAASTSGSTSSSTSSGSGCFVQCDRRCSYPGHCRRYTDTNNNGRCDLGECA